MTTADSLKQPSKPRHSLSADQARRLVLSAQGLATPPAAQTSVRRLRSLLRQLGAIQIDSINVLARSHELVLAARTGANAGDLFSKAVYRDRIGFEYWGHAASFLPIETYRLFLPRMARYASGEGRSWFTKSRTAFPDVYGAVLDRIRGEGALPASAFRDAPRTQRGSWWDWSPAKAALEDLHAQGVLLVHDRVRFERRYDLAERVLPRGLDLSPPTPHEAATELILLAARALGVGTAEDLQDYFRLSSKEARAAIGELVGSGLLELVSVQGWAAPAYVLPGVRIPRKTDFPPVLLSPFDSLVWATGAPRAGAVDSGARERTRRVFGFDYKLEIYLPPGQRTHGYYTTPVLANGRLVARIDPKLDRPSGRLLLRAVHIEPGIDLEEAVDAVATASRRLATALGATQVVLEGQALDGLQVSGELVVASDPLRSMLTE